MIDVSSYFLVLLRGGLVVGWCKFVADSCVLLMNTCVKDIDYGRRALIHPQGDMKDTLPWGVVESS